MSRYETPSGHITSPSYPLLQPLLSRARSQSHTRNTRKEDKYEDDELPPHLHDLQLDPSPFDKPSSRPSVRIHPRSSASTLSSHLSNTYLSSLLRHAKRHMSSHHMLTTHRMYQRAVLLHVHQHAFPNVLVDIIIEYLASYRLAVSFGTNIDIYDMHDGKPSPSLSMAHDDDDDVISPTLSPTLSPTSSLYHTFANITVSQHVDRLNAEITNEHTIRAMTVLSDGTLITTSASPMSRHEHINIWDVREKKLVRHHKKAPTAYISCGETLFIDNTEATRPSHLQQPQRIIVGCDDSSLRVYNVDTNTYDFISSYPHSVRDGMNTGHAQGVSCIHQLCDGRIVSGGFDHIIRIWELPINATHTRSHPPLPYRCVVMLQGHMDCVSGIAELSTSTRITSTSTSSYLASVSFDGTTKIWDLQHATCIQTLTEHTTSITCITVLADGTLLTGSRDGTIHVYITSSSHGIPHYTWLTSVNVGHEGRTYLRRLLALPALPSPSPVTFLTATSDGCVKMWSVTYTHPITSISTTQHTVSLTSHPVTYSSLLDSMDDDTMLCSDTLSPSPPYSATTSPMMHITSSSPSPSSSPLASAPVTPHTSHRTLSPQPHVHITCICTMRQKAPIDSRICVTVLPPD